MKEIYADHAATTYPRPPEVTEAMSSYLVDLGCSPGRGGYRRSLAAARLVYEARQTIADFFQVPSPEQVVFTPSITYSLNTVIKGLLHRGDHVVTSSMEHNAVVRPLTRLQEELGITVDYLPCKSDGTMDAEQVKAALRPNTRLVLLTHASNVTGTLLPVREVGEILRDRGVFYAVDTAQTAGSEPVSFREMGCDILAFTGHKGLLGPPGIGGMCLSARAASHMRSLVEGGTGSRSEQETQPDFLPDKFESGTQNVPGIAGLAAGIKAISRMGIETIRENKKQLLKLFLEGLSLIEGITVYGPMDPEKMTATVSLNVQGLDSGDLSFILDQSYNIMTRSGLHCAPLAHKTIGTFPAGTLRFSFGYGNTESDVQHILQALGEIVNDNKNAADFYEQV